MTDDEPKPSTSGYISSSKPVSSQSCSDDNSTGWISVSRKPASASSGGSQSDTPIHGLERSTSVSLENLHEVKKEKSADEQERASQSPCRTNNFESKDGKTEISTNRSLMKTNENSTTHGNGLVKEEDSQYKPKYSVPLLYDDGGGAAYTDDFADNEFGGSSEVGKITMVVAHRTSKELPKPEGDSSPVTNEQPTTEMDSTTSSAVLNEHLILFQTTAPVRRNSNKKRGVSFDDSDSDSGNENSETNISDNSQEKYQRIILENKQKLKSSGWVDARKNKKKVFKNSLFKR